MSQRNSGYERRDRELYETPAWVTRALIPHLPPYVDEAWEPACGSGLMTDALYNSGIVPVGTDINGGADFLAYKFLLAKNIITNPPYLIAQEFIEHALKLTWPTGMVAMLLGSDYDHAKTRRHLFDEHPAFCKTVVLTERIKWFDEPVPCKACNGTGLNMWGVKCKPCGGKGEKNVGPSENHCWFIWDWQHKGPSTKAYGP